MELPFTADEFYGVFGQYNEAFWPVQVFLLGLAVTALVLMLKPRSWSGIVISAILVFLWAWLGVAYHFIFFSRINPLAYVFSGVSLAGAFVFLWQGIIRRSLQFAWVGGIRAIVGALLIVFALIVYPAWSWYAGHQYPLTPTFGLPCPTTLFTIGLLAFLVAPYPAAPFVVPILWSIIGAQAAFLLGVPQDIALIPAGIVAGVLLLRSRMARRR